MKIFILSVVLAVVYSSPGPHPDRPDCTVSDWGSWGKCESTKLCSSKPRPPAYSYHVDPAVHDHGAARMDFLKQRKGESFDRIKKCRSDPDCKDVFMRDNEGFVPCTNGFVNELPCDGVDQMSFINFETLTGGDPAALEVNDIWGWVDPENGDEYAIVCVYSGTSFVRMTDPQNPVVVGYMPTRTDPSNWRDAKVIGNYAFSVSEARDHGMQIYDLTQLRNSDGFQIVEPTALYSEFGNCHNIVADVETNFVYGVGATGGNYPNICNGGLHAVDVSDPLNPRFAGCFGGDGYVHDAQCTIYTGPDTEHQGKELCFCFNEDSLTIVDVTDKSDMNIISKESYLGYAYTHQGWLTEDQAVVLLDDELDEFYASSDDDKYTRTFIWDISDLESPQLMNTYYSSQKSIDHNQYIKGQLTYQSNYLAGLRILQIDQENYNLNEVAYFDTNAQESADFSGSWSNYPYLPSGNIPLGSIDFGFFIVRPNMEYIEKKIKTKQFGHQTRSRNIVHRSSIEAPCPPLVEKKPCVPEC